MPSGLASPACSAIAQEFFRSAPEAARADTAAPGAASPPARTGRPPARTLHRTRPATEQGDHRLPSRTRPPRLLRDPTHLEVDHAVTASMITTRRTRVTLCGCRTSRGARPPFCAPIGIPGSRYHVWAEARTTRGRRDRTIRPVNTATVLADAMTDYVLTVGVNRAAPAAGAPEHMAAWLEAHGYHVVHHSQVGRQPRRLPPCLVAPAD